MENFDKIICDICDGTGEANSLINDEMFENDNVCFVCNGSGFIDIMYNESIVPHKRSRNERRLRKKQRRLAQRGNNFKSVKPKKGFKRVKIGNRYVRVRMGSNERKVKKLVGRAVGRKSRIFR